MVQAQFSIEQEGERLWIRVNALADDKATQPERDMAKLLEGVMVDLSARVLEQEGFVGTITVDGQSILDTDGEKAVEDGL